MKILDILTEALAKNLSNFQKGLLASISQAATPEQAYTLAIGSEISMKAVFQLQSMGYIVLNGKNIGLTSNGRQAAIDANLILPNGQLTDEGKTQVSEYERNKQEFINAH